MKLDVTAYLSKKLLKKTHTVVLSAVINNITVRRLTYHAVTFIVVWYSYCLTNHLTTYDLDASSFLFTTISLSAAVLSSSSSSLN
jgi:hypothetical protein